MLLSSEAIAKLIEESSKGMTPQAGAIAARAACEVRTNGTTARLDSNESKSLHSILDSHRELLTDEAIQRLAGVELFGVESSYINAYAIQDQQGREGIVLFQGLCHLIHYFADLITVLRLLQSNRSDATIDDGLGGVHSEVELFSLAGFSLLSEYLSTGHILPNLHEMLSEQHRQNVKLGFAAAIVFVVLHELAHLHLGHVYLGKPRSESSALALLEPELLSEEQQDELDADSQALQWIAEAYRGPIQSSLIFMLGSHAFIEAFSDRLSKSHPLAVNRLSQLAQAADLSVEDRQIVNGWIEDRANRYRDFAQARLSAGGSIQGNIQRTMSIEHAWAVINEVKRRVIAEHGYLG